MGETPKGRRGPASRELDVHLGKSARVHGARESRATGERGLGPKRALALREFALGIEAVERFVRGGPLRRAHECVFGVLAVESERVDPRL